ncbi:membrane-bound O-acyltransferase domain-containing protein 2 [Exaiptasia diaphana]|uniref:Uncharacterized protein n=1 Tax=Exaiptasia diaphana TaxID=2652724 RepID=A0A913WPE0_EXADI|nr:membrane-bound O-acyltransferase domain-containing protein 2 [Exaiptasia diaphana]
MAREILEILASHIKKYPYDQVSFISCILFSYPLGIVYRRLFHASNVSPQTRQTVGLAWGVLFGWICFKWQLFNIIGTTTLCYLLTVYVHPKYTHRVVLVVSLAILSTSHLMRQIYDYGSYKLDYTGPLMILVQKVTYIAFSVHDGKDEKEEDLTPDQKEEQLKEVPRPLEYFGYCLHYTMLLSGPVSTYRQYKDFINGTEKNKREESNFTPVLRKSLASLICLVLFLNFSSRFSISRNVDESFINNQSFVRRLLYAWISIAILRMQYYFAFKAGEAVNNLCGLGFSGYDKDGNALWDSMANVNIFKIEFGLNCKMVLENWNITTVWWLRRTAYDRLTNHRTMGVFVLSAVWHGFYGGYYLTFFTSQLFVEAFFM